MGEYIKTIAEIGAMMDCGARRDKLLTPYMTPYYNKGEKYWKNMDMKCRHREVEATIIHFEKRGVIPLLFQSINLLRKYIFKW